MLQLTEKISAVVTTRQIGERLIQMHFHLIKNITYGHEVSNLFLGFKLCCSVLVETGLQINTQAEILKHRQKCQTPELLMSLF